MFFFLRCATIRWMSSTATGSTPAKGSSRRTNFGSVAKALAISVLLRSPPESKSPLFFLMWLRPNSYKSDSIFSF